MYDTRLVTAAQQGDELAFAALFDRNVDAVHDLCWALTGDRDEAARIVGDVFTLVARHLGELTDASQLRPWLLAIARDRVLSEDQAGTLHTAWGARPEQPLSGGVPLGGSDLRWWTREAASVLALADQVVIELAFRYDLDADQLAAAIGVSADDLPQVLDQVEQEADLVLGALVLARQGQRDCPDLADLLEGWDGVPTVEVAESVDLHARTCGRCVRRLSVAHPLELLGSAPPVPPSPELRAIVLEQAGAELPHPPAESSSRRGRGAATVVDAGAAFAAENVAADVVPAGSVAGPDAGPATEAMPGVGGAGAGAAGGAALAGAGAGTGAGTGPGGTGAVGRTGGGTDAAGAGGSAGEGAGAAEAGGGAAGTAVVGAGVAGAAGGLAAAGGRGPGGGATTGGVTRVGGAGGGGGVAGGGGPGSLGPGSRGPGGRSSLELRLRERPWVALAAVGTAIVILVVAVVLLISRGGSSPTRVVAAPTTNPPTTVPPTTTATTLASQPTLLPLDTSTTTSTTAPKPTTTSTTAAPVGQLALNATSVTLGSSATAAQVVLTDTGKGPSAWTASSTVPWLTVSPGSGTLAAGAAVTVTLTLDRAAAPTGAFSVQVQFTQTGTPPVSITVVGSNTSTSTTSSSTTSTTAPGSTTTQPGGSTTKPPTTTTLPSGTTSQPPTATTLPKSTSTTA